MVPIAPTVRAWSGVVDSGVLVTVPALKSQKPRKVMAAALADHGAKVLLYLSAKPDGVEKGNAGGAQGFPCAPPLPHFRPS
jgi:hypothetical protein